MNLFDFYIPEWIFVAINLIVLTAVLTKVLWKPVNRILEERKAMVEKGISDAREAEKAKADIEVKQAAFEDDMHRETAEQMKQARVRAGHEYDRIISEAQEKSRKIISAAQVSAEHERESMLSSVRKEIVVTSLDVAEMLVEKSMDSEENRRLIEAYLQKSAPAGKAVEQ